MAEACDDVSVVVPALNEEEALGATILSLRRSRVREILVVDGGSHDRTLAVARELSDLAIQAPRGRARQMNAGAAHAKGSILVFVHADTIVPAEFADSMIAACRDPDVIGGRFDVDLVPSSPLLWLTGELINLRSRWSRMSTGDQAIFIRRSVFEELGGYASIPLMEDLDLSVRMKRRGKIACLRRRVATSSRRWRRNGVIRTILLMWTLRFLYACGVAPETLKTFYANTR